METVVEHRVFRVHHANLGRQLLVAHVAAKSGRSAAGTGAADDPVRHRIGFVRHLGENGVGDIIVAAPVCGALGIGELVHVMTIQLLRQTLGFVVNGGRIVHQVAAPAIEFDGANFFLRGALGHHRDEGQAQQAGKIGLGHSGATAGCLDDGAAFAYPAIAQTVQKQGARQPVLEAAGGVSGFVLEIELYLRRAGDGQRNQMRVAGAIEIGLDLAHCLGNPISHLASPVSESSQSAILTRQARKNAP